MSVVAVLLAVLLSVEYLLEWRVAWRQRAAERQIRPYYPWAFYTRSGVRFAGWRGYLKLELSPGIVYRNAPGQRTPYFNTNSRGFRGLKEPAAVRAGERIVVVGGSLAFGTGLNADSETFAERLADLTGAEVLNAASIGHRSGQELVYLATELIDLGPTLVLAVNCWNDFSQEWLSPLIYPPFGFNAFELIDDHVAASQRLLSAPLPSRLLRLHSILLPALEREISRALKRATARSSPQDTRWKAPIMAETYAHNMRKIAALSTAIGARFLCALQPVRTTGTREDLATLSRYASFRAEVKSRLRRDNVEHIDLNEHMAAFPDSSFLDLTHLDGSGHLSLARLIAERIGVRARSSVAAS